VLIRSRCHLTEAQHYEASSNRQCSAPVQDGLLARVLLIRVERCRCPNPGPGFSA